MWVAEFWSRNRPFCEKTTTIGPTGDGGRIQAEELPATSEGLPALNEGLPVGLRFCDDFEFQNYIYNKYN